MRQTQRNRRNRPLEVEPLESMMLLSGLTMVNRPAMAAPIVTSMPQPVSVSLSGTTRGIYAFSNFNPDLGTAYSLSTSGKFANYGPAVVFGNLHSLGNVASGQATGTLFVIVPGGTLTLRLTGPTQPGFSPLPTTFSFVVTKGTGKFHNAPMGSGTVDVALKPFGSSMNKFGTGQVTLTFHPAAAAMA
jgi:hypothetical protein